MSKLTQEYVQKLFHYNPKTGILTRKVRTHGHKKGSVVGRLTSGYLNVNIQAKPYRVHNIIWLHVYGKFPKGIIDHINQNPIDNRLCNLRETNYAGNSRNAAKSRLSKTLVRGIYWSKFESRWKASIYVKGKTYYLGQSLDFCELVCLRLAAEQCIDWDSYKHNSEALAFVKEHIQK